MRDVGLSVRAIQIRLDIRATRYTHNMKYKIPRQYNTHSMHDAHTFDRDPEFRYAKVYKHARQQTHWQFSVLKMPFQRDEITFRNFSIAFKRKHY